MAAAAPDLTPVDPGAPQIARVLGGGAVDRRRWRVDATILALVALALRIPAFLSPRSLVFDDGVFASSALAMRAGGAPFREVFSSQGPLFLPFVWLGDLAGARTIDSPRVLAITSGIVVTVAVYAIARHLTTRPAAILAAVLATTSGSILWVTGPLTADGPSMAAALTAIALALRARGRRPTGSWWVVGVGVVAGVALSIKLLAMPAVVIAGLVVLDVRGRRRDGLVAATTAAAVWLLAALPWGIQRVWEQSFEYHRSAPRRQSHLEAAWLVLRTLWDRDVLVVAIVALAGLGVLLARRRGGTIGRGRDVRAPALLALWILLTFALLVWEPALWRPHVAHLVPPLILLALIVLAALRLPPARVLAAGILVAMPFWVQHNRAVLLPERYEAQEAALVRALSGLPSRAQAISDDPGWVWRAGLRTPDNLVDPSFLRLEAGQITAGSLTRAAARPEVCAVVASSPRHFLRFPNLPRRLAAEGYRARRFGPRVRLFVKDSCDARDDRIDGAGPLGRSPR